MALQPDTVTAQDYRKSLASLHLSVMLLGLSSVLGQLVSAPAVIVAGGRVICSSLVLLLLCLIGRQPLKLHSGRDYQVAIFAGIILAIHWTTFFQSIQSASVAIGTITFSTFPLFLTFLEPALFHETLRARSVLSAVVLLIGVIITIPEFSIENQTTMGVLWGMVCSLAYAILSLANRYLSRSYVSRTICLYEQGTAALVLLPSFVLIKTQWSIQNIAGIAVMGFVCTAFAHSLYVSAQKQVRAQTAGIISGLETVYGIMYALVFLGEIPTARELIGGAIILGVALFTSLQTTAETS